MNQQLPLSPSNNLLQCQQYCCCHVKDRWSSLPVCLRKEPNQFTTIYCQLMKNKIKYKKKKHFSRGHYTFILSHSIRQFSWYNSQGKPKHSRDIIRHMTDDGLEESAGVLLHYQAHQHLRVSKFCGNKIWLKSSSADICIKVEKRSDDSDTESVPISGVLEMTTWCHTVQYITVSSQYWRWNTSTVERLMNLALVFYRQLCWMFKYTDHMLPWWA